MWLSCDDIHIRIGTFTYRYCWEITSERTMYNMQNVLGNFTELQTLSSNNSNGVVQRCLIKGNYSQLALATRTFLAAMKGSNRAYRASSPFKMYRACTSIGRNISHCLPPSVSCFYLFFFSFFFLEKGNDSVSLSIRNIIFFKASLSKVFIYECRRFRSFWEG